MKSGSQKSVITAIGISLILIAVLSRRIFARNMNTETILGFLTGMAVMIISFLIFRAIMRNKQ